MKEGDIVKAALQQSDGSYKLRPALVLKKMPPYGDFLLCGISSQLWNFTEGFDEKILEVHQDYSSSGLIRPSVIRLGFLATVDAQHIEGTIGSISHSTYIELVDRLVNHLKG